MDLGVRFPRLNGRRLTGEEVALPDAFDGDRNVAIVAFQRHQQSMVDSWMPWLEDQSAADGGLRVFEIPAIGRIWAPVRNFIDGGMAHAIADPVVLHRTITVYGDVSTLTTPLGIDDRSTIWLFLLDRTCTVRWRGNGGFDPDRAERLGAALARCE